MSASLKGLYAITDATLLPTQEQLLFACEQALLGGAQLLQYREKSQNKRKRLAEGRALANLCAAYQRTLIINDDLELAAELGVGLHLGQKDGSVEQARRLLGDQAIIGATCHQDLALAKRAAEEGASYVAFGACFPSQTKPLASRAPIELFQNAAEQIHLPKVAIGGLNLDNSAQVIAAGAEMIAVVHALFSSTDIRQQAQAFSALFSNPV
ncbi:thiamine phosphate synthase [Nitrincola tapanii]|uniref:Thiamine-phosphate synthase n=1 Tax=Nitrincola tapanii TaxID=1708751 RepID=A0A5A9VZB1_9GAMM|nr:thiamine phosphate synthase [Nitrincola tapanii]KAA0873652.1 thiamine phosphate synthase [Nitrincola tapanii]